MKFNLICLIFSLTIPTFLFSQDSLIITKSSFGLNEKVEFIAKVSVTRSVGTMSCACGNSDFYYKVFTLEDGEWQLFIDHTETEQGHCTCISMPAMIINDKKYSILALKKPGIYYIEIADLDFVCKTTAFSISE